jgi:serine protease Do
VELIETWNLVERALLMLLVGALLSCDLQHPDPVAKPSVLAAAVLPAVVRITPEGDRAQAAGTGFFIQGHEGGTLIATNYHVIWEATKIVFEQSNSVRGRAILVGVDRSIDFALLRPEAALSSRLLTWGRDSDLELGDFLLSVGSVEGGSASVSAGVVSAHARIPDSPLVGQRLVDHVFTDAVISPGNSGGPVLDSHGRLVGMNAAVAGRSRGLGIVVPAPLLRDAAWELERRGRCSHAFSGFEVAEGGCSVAAALRVVSVSPDGPAQVAGLRAGDCIIAVQGGTLHGPRDLRRRLYMTRAGTQWTLELLRANSRLHVTLQLGDAVQSMSQTSSADTRRSE